MQTNNLNHQQENLADNQQHESFNGQEKVSEIPFLDYASMSLETLYHEGEKLLQNQKVQHIKKHIDAIRIAFEQKFALLLEEKKQQFLNEGGQEQDFEFVYPLKTEFEKWYKTYKHKLSQFHKAYEETLQANLARKQDLITEIKNLVHLGDDQNDSEEKEWNVAVIRKKFFELRDEFRKIGAVPKEHYEEIWKNFNHHADKFYDFLTINRELQEMDYKHNLEEKQRLIAQARALLLESDMHKASRELQRLHRTWKEETGPVSKEHRESVWEEFRRITEEIHQKRDKQHQQEEAVLQGNAQAKQAIINKIETLVQEELTQHNQWQKAIKELEALREEFKQIGKVPQAQIEPLWVSFKTAVTTFNRKKNSFYKNLKHIQADSLQQKKALLEVALSHKDSENWEETAALLKEVQKQWRQTDALLNSKQSNELWNEFRGACNAFFDRYTVYRKELRKQETQLFKEKKVILDKVKTTELTGNYATDVQVLHGFSKQWEAMEKTSIGDIDIRFNKIMNALYHKLKAEKEQAGHQKYAVAIEQMSQEEKIREQNFVRRKIDEVKAELLQVENNLHFFVNIDKKNSIYKNATKALEQKKEALAMWQNRLKELKAAIQIQA